MSSLTGRYGRPAYELRVLVALSLYFIGLLLLSFYPAVLTTGETTLLRPDWVLSLPLLFFVGLRIRRLRLSRPHFLTVVLIGIGAVSAFIGPLYSASQFLTVTAQMVYLFGVFVALSSLDLTTDLCRRLLHILVIFISIIGVHTIYESVALNTALPYVSVYPNPDPMGAAYGGYIRPSSIFAEPTELAMVFVIVVTILVPAVAAGRPILFSRRTQYRLLSLGLACLLVTGSIAGYLVLAIALGFVFVAVPTARPVLLLATLVSVLVAVITTPILVALGFDLVTMTVDRFARLFTVLSQSQIVGTNSISLRYIRMVTGLKVAMSAPIIGVGMGQYAGYILTEPAFVTGPYSTEALAIINSGWFLLFADTGLLGLLAFSLVWLHIVRRGFGLTTRVSEDAAHVVRINIVLVCVAVSIILFNFSYVHPYPWIFGGLAVAYFSTLTDCEDTNTFIRYIETDRRDTGS